MPRSWRPSGLVRVASAAVRVSSPLAPLPSETDPATTHTSRQSDIWRVFLQATAQPFGDRFHADGRPRKVAFKYEPTGRTVLGSGQREKGPRLTCCDRGPTCHDPLPCVAVFGVDLRTDKSVVDSPAP
jgi:hypothetical protein